MVKDISELRYLNTGPISNVGCATFSLLAAVKHRSGVRPSVCLFRVFFPKVNGGGVLLKCRGPAVWYTDFFSNVNAARISKLTHQMAAATLTAYTFRPEVRRPT